MKKLIGILFAGLLICTLCIPALATEGVERIDIFSGGTYTVNSDVTLIEGNLICMSEESTLRISESGFLSSVGTEILLSGLGHKIELKDGGGLYLTFINEKSANTFCQLLLDSGISFHRDGNAIQAGVCKHTNGVHTVCKQCGQPISNYAGSIFSEGSLTIIVGVACLAVGFLVAMFIFKKKKPVLASGESKNEE